MGIAAQHFTTKTKISELLNLENKKKPDTNHILIQFQP